MLDWPCHFRGQIKRSLCGGDAGEFVKSDSAVCVYVTNVVQSLCFPILVFIFLKTTSGLKQN